jgi:hypothetical protein
MLTNTTFLQSVEMVPKCVENVLVIVCWRRGLGMLESGELGIISVGRRSNGGTAEKINNRGKMNY